MTTLTLIEELDGLQILEAKIRSLQEEPHKAYLLAHQIEKLGSGIKKEFKEGFEEYYFKWKELPAGFSAKESQRASYQFSDDPEYARIEAMLKNREEKLKTAHVFNDKNQTYFDENGEQIPLVVRTFAQIVSVSRK